MGPIGNTASVLPKRRPYLLGIEAPPQRTTVIRVSANACPCRRSRGRRSEGRVGPIPSWVASDEQGRARAGPIDRSRIIPRVSWTSGHRNRTTYSPTPAPVECLLHHRPAIRGSSGRRTDPTDKRRREAPYRMNTIFCAIETSLSLARTQYTPGRDGPRSALLPVQLTPRVVMAGSSPSNNVATRFP